MVSLAPTTVSTKPVVRKSVRLPYEPDPVLERYVYWALTIIRMVARAEASLAARREEMRFGTAIAEIIPIIATTIRSSIRLKPDCRCGVVISVVFVDLRLSALKEIAEANRFASAMGK